MLSLVTRFALCTGGGIRFTLVTQNAREHKYGNQSRMYNRGAIQSHNRKQDANPRNSNFLTRFPTVTVARGTPSTNLVLLFPSILKENLVLLRLRWQ